MTRLLIFKHPEGKYVLEENGLIVFEIDDKTLLFDSLKFYQGLYEDKSKSVRIRLTSDLQEKDKVGARVALWIEKIIQRIATSLGECDPEDIVEETGNNVIELPVPPTIKRIPYFDLPVCAGNGLYTDSPSTTMLDVNFAEADYAVRVAGNSMEPQYADGSILLVKKQDTLNEGDIAILSINGESFCRKFHREKGKEYFSPINPSPDYQIIAASESVPVVIQGKVVGVYSATAIIE